VFDPALPNLAGEWQPGQLLKALQRSSRGSLCFHGPPGTGKSQFDEALAEALDRELTARQASELISPYVRALSPAQRRVLFAREVYGDAEAPIPALTGRHLDQLELLIAGDVANVCQQHALLGEDFGAEPEPFLRRLIQECRFKGGEQVMAA
jgi:hypothetical protein